MNLSIRSEGESCFSGSGSSSLMSVISSSSSAGSGSSSAWISDWGSASASTSTAEFFSGLGFGAGFGSGVLFLLSPVMLIQYHPAPAVRVSHEILPVFFLRVSPGTYHMSFRLQLRQSRFYLCNKLFPRPEVKVGICRCQFRFRECLCTGFICSLSTGAPLGSLSLSGLFNIRLLNGNGFHHSRRFSLYYLFN